MPVILFKLSPGRFETLATVLCGVAVFTLAKAVDSVYGLMCDPRIKVAGAPPFGSTAIYGVPVWAAFLLAIGSLLILIGSISPASLRVIARFRFAFVVGCMVIAVVLPSLPFPHRTLGACLS